MKNLIISSIFFLICGICHSQIYEPVAPTTYGEHQLRYKPGLVLHVPVAPPGDTGLHTADTSAQIKIIDGVLKYHFGKWKTVGSDIGISLFLAQASTGYKIARGLNDSTIRFKTLVAGSNITLDSSTTDTTIVINSSGGGTTPNLQQVTDIGSTTTNTLDASAFRVLREGAYVGYIQGVSNGAGGWGASLRIKDPYTSYYANLLAQNSMTAEAYLFLPNSGNVNRTLPVSVNGNYANAAGNITVSTGGGTSTRFGYPGEDVSTDVDRFIGMSEHSLRVDSASVLQFKTSTGAEYTTGWRKTEYAAENNSVVISAFADDDKDASLAIQAGSGIAGSASGSDGTSSIQITPADGGASGLAKLRVFDAGASTDLTVYKNNIIVTGYGLGNTTNNYLPISVDGVFADATGNINLNGGGGGGTVGTITWLGTTYNINSGNNVTLTTPTTTNISEGTNLYYTDTRARAAISLTTTGAGAATYNNTTGVLNIPTPSGGGGGFYGADGNDNIDDAIVIYNDASVTGNNGTATSQSLDPPDANYTVWFLWESGDAVDVNINTSGSTNADGIEMDTKIWIGTYSGGVFTSLAENDDGNNSVSSNLTFSAAANTVYYICLAGYSSVDDGNYFLNLHTIPESSAGGTTPTLQQVIAAGQIATSTPEFEGGVVLRNSTLGFLSNSLTSQIFPATSQSGAWSYTLPNKSGTFAMLDDIVSLNKDMKTWASYINTNKFLPEFTPQSTKDKRGEIGRVTYDKEYIYIKTEDGWRRSSLSKF